MARRRKPGTRSSAKATYRVRKSDEPRREPLPDLVTVHKASTRSPGKSRTESWVKIDARFVRFLKEFKDGDVKVLLFLLFHADRDGVCWLRVEKLAEDLGFGRKKTYLILKRLSEMEVEGRKVLARIQTRKKAGEFGICRFLIWPTDDELAAIRDGLDPSKMDFSHDEKDKYEVDSVYPKTACRKTVHGVNCDKVQRTVWPPGGTRLNRKEQIHSKTAFCSCDKKSHEHTLKVCDEKSHVNGNGNNGNRIHKIENPVNEGGGKTLPGVPPRVSGTSPSRRKIPDSDHHRFIAFVDREFERQTGIPYDWTGKDFPLVKRLLSRFGPERLRAITRHVMADPWVRERGFSVGILSTQANQAAFVLGQKAKNRLRERIVGDCRACSGAGCSACRSEFDRVVREGFDERA